MEIIDNIEIFFLQNEDYNDIKNAMLEVYPNMVEASWNEKEIRTLIKKFPEGQVGIRIDGELAGCALSIIVDHTKFEAKHTYKQITGDSTFNTHNPKGNVLYGIDVLIRPKFRGMRLGRRDRKSVV